MKTAEAGRRHLRPSQASRVLIFPLPAIPRVTFHKTAILARFRAKLHCTGPRETASKNASQARGALNLYPNAGSAVNTTVKKRFPER